MQLINLSIAGKLTVQAINDNINLLYEEMRPTLENILASFLQNSVGAMSQEFSEEELYPTSKS